MDYKLSPVSLDQIETDDRTFKISTNENETDLALSISAIGLLQPPILLKQEFGYIVVCGFRRIAACAALAMACIPARILRSDFSKITCAQIAISDNSRQRPLNIVEQSRAYNLVRRFAEGSSAWCDIVESTGLAVSQTAMDRIIPVADMPVAMQDALLEGSIALPVALHINQLNPDDASAFCVFFRTLTTGLNVQRELVELISEISIRDGISIVRLMEQDDISAILANRDFSAPQKVRELRLMLKAKRYPELSRAEALYAQKLKSLKLDPRVQLHPPRFFEGNTYRLSLTVDSRRQLKSLKTELEKLIQHPTLLPE
jgi:ParB family transcriptional regulator, chromosome partitioning protein